MVRRLLVVVPLAVLLVANGPCVRVDPRIDQIPRCDSIDVEVLGEDPESLVGVWQYSAGTMDALPATDVATRPSFWIFEEDGTGRWHYYERHFAYGHETGTFTWEVDGDRLTIDDAPALALEFLTDNGTTFARFRDVSSSDQSLDLVRCQPDGPFPD